MRVLGLLITLYMMRRLTRQLDDLEARFVDVRARLFYRTCHRYEVH